MAPPSSRGTPFAFWNWWAAGIIACTGSGIWMVETAPFPWSIMGKIFEACNGTVTCLPSFSPNG
jgi:hypothetical protein